MKHVVRAIDWWYENTSEPLLGLIVICGLIAGIVSILMGNG